MNFTFDDSRNMADKSTPQLMLIPRSTSIRRHATFGVALVLLASGVRGFSDDSKKGSETKKTSTPEKIETAPEKSLLDFRAYRPADSIFNSSGVQGPDPGAIPIPRPSAPSISRQDSERLDREKNWIFLRPGDEKQQTVEELLGVAMPTIDDGKAKGLVEKFLENKQTPEPSRSNKSGTMNFLFSNGSTVPVFGTRQNSAFGNNPVSGLRAWDQSVSGWEAPTGNNGGGQMSLAERWQALHQPGAEKALENRRTQMNEFENLFNSQNIAQNFGGLNALPNSFGTPAPNSPSSDLNPFNRAFGNNERTSPDESRILQRPFSTANPLSQPSINERVFGASAAPLPTPEPQRSVSQPAMLPIPKRHF